ncbi:unnamed protein product, partial [marine sediment metagenome]
RDITNLQTGTNRYDLRTYNQWAYNLKSNTEYYFRGVVQNGKGTGTGDWVKFTTLEE